MEGEELHCIRRPARRQAEGEPLLLMLHGYGSDEEDLMGLAPYLDERLDLCSARAPQALDFGGYAWFHVEFAQAGIAFQAAEALAARERVRALVRRLGAGRSLLLLGFSQGASVALAAALAEPGRLAGVAALSGAYTAEMLSADGERVRGLPVFMSHGRQDPVIGVGQARSGRRLLQGLPLELEYREYDMGHEIGPQCLEDLRVWLGARLD